MKLYVEGGGDSKLLQIECRRGFREFLEKAGLKGRMPAIFAGGGRYSAYRDYCTAVANGDMAMLLVDSEAQISEEHQRGGDEKEWLPWSHLNQRQGDGWVKPSGCAETDCHFMVQVMESWFLADRVTLQDFFGSGFNANALPVAGNSLEGVAKTAVYDALQKAPETARQKLHTTRVNTHSNCWRR